MNYIHSIYQNYAACREEGSALITVLIITVIITILMGGVFAGAQLQRAFIQQDISEQEALYKAEAGIYEYLATRPNLNQVQGRAFSYTLSDSSQVELQASVYGGFYNIRSTARVNSKAKSIRVLVGQKAPEVYSKAVVIGDSTSALSLTGSTSITGDIRVGRKGVETTSFKGFPFSGKLDGEIDIHTGSPLLPSFKLSTLSQQFDHYEGVFNDPLYRFPKTDSVEVLRWLKEGDTDVLRVSGDLTVVNTDDFPDDNRPLTLYIEGNLVLNGKFKFAPYSRIIVSDTLLMGGSTEGQHLFVYAGKSLQVGGNTQASGQFLSRGNIRIRDNAYLEYPSLVFSNKEFNDAENTDVIRFMGQSSIDGTVLYPIRTNRINQGLLKVKIDEGATVRGAIFTQGQTELEGEVLGSVLTRQFYFYESPTSYINWMKDSKIDITKRPANYVVPIGFGDPTLIQYDILDWEEVDYE